MLAVFQRCQRHFGMGLARSGDDDDVNFGRFERLPIIHAPVQVAIGLGKSFSLVGLTPHQGMQHALGIAQAL
ncbi:hypothetical protein D3C84_934780 [compost metagenome]